MAIIWALGELGDRKAAPTLRHIARCHEDAILRESATQALARLADPESIEIFIEQGCRSYNSELRKATARALGQLKAERAVSQLVGLLEDEDRRVREAATEALCQIDEAAVLREIRKRMERERFVSTAILHVVDLLGQSDSKEAAELLSMLLRQLEPYFDCQEKEQHLRRRIAQTLGALVGRTDQIDLLLQTEKRCRVPLSVSSRVFWRALTGGPFLCACGNF